MIVLRCMGGWCLVRESCRHYHSDTWRKPVERACEPGETNLFAPLRRADVHSLREPELQQKGGAE